MRSITFFTFGLTAILLLSCSKHKEEDMLDMSCESAMCTDMLVTISAKVVDNQGKPVALTQTRVTRLSNGEVLTNPFAKEDWRLYQQYGNYPIVSDLHDKVLPKFKKIPVRFQGYIGSKEVINTIYTVAFDCCHISLISGEREIVVR